MTFRTYVYDRFSPYLDDDPWVDFFDDIAQRGTTIVAAVLAVHVALFFVMNANFIVPDLKDDEPEPIPIQIISFEDLQPEPEPEPEIIDAAPVAPPPAPSVKPRPKPTPQPAPPPPPPPVEEVVIEPQPIAAPPPPDILVNDTPTESENTIPEFTPPEPIQEPIVEPIIEPPVIPEPVPQPQIEIFEPLPEPIQQPVFEPIIEPAPQYEIEIFEPAPIIEPEPLPEPILEQVIEPDPVIEQTPLEPILEIAPVIPPEPIEVPAPVVEPEVEIEIFEIRPLIAPSQFELAPDPVEPTEEEIIEPELDDAPIITTAPTILASPDAPSTSDEIDKAVPQEQAAPITDFLFNPNTRVPTPQAPVGRTSRPSAPPGGGSSGGAISLDGSGGIPGGGTQRSSGQSSNTGWALAPQGGEGSFGEGGKGIVMDIRCREAKRTHADCPAYLAQFKGRNAAGYENFGAHSNGTVAGSTRGARAGTHSNQAVGGGRDPWSANIGDNSINAGGPSSSVLDDADFGREFLGTNLGDGSQPQRLRDLIKEPSRPWDGGVIELPQAPEEDEDEN